MADAAATPAQDPTPAAAGVQSGTAAVPPATTLTADPAAAVAPAAAATTADGTPDGQGDGKPATGAPEQYEFKTPDGFENLDTAALEQFTPLAKELNLTQEQAQKFVDLYGREMSRIAQAQQEALVAQAEQWAAQTKGDKELGGQAFDTNVATAQKALAKFGTPELKQALDATGMGNHPEVIRFFLRIGRAISEDNLAFGQQPAGGGRDPKALYPNSNHS